MSSRYLPPGSSELNKAPSSNSLSHSFSVNSKSWPQPCNEDMSDLAPTLPTGFPSRLTNRRCSFLFKAAARHKAARGLTLLYDRSRTRSMHLSDCKANASTWVGLSPKVL